MPLRGSSNVLLAPSHRRPVIRAPLMKQSSLVSVQEPAQQQRQVPTRPRLMAQALAAPTVPVRPQDSSPWGKCSSERPAIFAWPANTRPNPSLERDLHRPGTWPARRSLSSSASRAKRHSGSGPSAQTLGLAVTPLVTFWQQAPTVSAGKRCLLRCTGLPSPASSQSVGGMPAPRYLFCPWLPRLLSRSRLFSQSNNAAPNRVNR